MMTETPNSDSCSKGVYRLPAFIVFIFLGFYFIHNSWVIFVDCHETGDYAANALQVVRANSFEELLGPYSRFRFNHPGPLLFYWRALFESLTPAPISPFAAHTLSQLVINLAALFFILIFAKQTVSRGFSLLLLLVLLLLINASDPALWSDTWGPPSVVFPFMLAAFASVRIFSGHTKSLYLLVIAGSVAAQTHISTVTPLLAFGGSALVFHLSSRSKKDPHTIVFAALLGIALWLPPLIEFFMSKGNGNLGRILHYIGKYPASHSYREALETVATLYQVPQVAGLQVEFFLIILCLAGLSVSRLGSPARYLYWGILSSLVLAMLTLVKSHGELHTYLVLYQLGLAASLYSFILLGVVRIFFPKGMHTAPRWYYSLVVAAVVGTSWITLPYPGNSLCNQEPQKLADTLSPNREVLYLFQFGAERGSPPWIVAVGLALWLERNGYQYCFPGRWGYLVGRSRTCRFFSADLQQKLIFFRKLPENSSERAPSARIIQMKNAAIVLPD